ncbi:MAG: hypothetical protein CMJ50_05900 [Planctomycetaceae bacterium]|jgi:hypothetical protein|nr:hypothetical protein [Planctomycetaceae bacterium]
MQRNFQFFDGGHEFDDESAWAFVKRHRSVGAARALRAQGMLDEADEMQNRTRNVAPSVALLPTGPSK